MADKKALTINDILDLAEKHNTMGQFVQQKLHEFRTGKRQQFDEVSKARIIDLLQEADGLGVEGAATMLAAVQDAPVQQEAQQATPADKKDSKSVE